MATAAEPKSLSHRWTFSRIGGVDQVCLDTGADILHLDQLDQKLWVALSCPVQGLEFDERTLALLDDDHDGHVRPPEILAAVKWLREVLVDGDTLLKGQDGVALAHIRQDTAEGRTLFASAQHILTSLGKDATVITVADSQQTADVFLKARRNGDGIVPPSAIADEKARAVAEAVIACVGGVGDRSGKTGFGQAQLDAFFTACGQYDAWQRLAEADTKNVMPFGDATTDAYAALAPVRAKVDDYFGRCRVAAYDPRALAAVNREQEAYMAAVAKDLTITASEIAHFPLALVEPGKPLPLGTGINPAWAAGVAAMRARCFPAAETLTETAWTQLCAKFDAHLAWLGKKAGAVVESLGKQPVRDILASNAKAALQEAIADDLELAAEVDAMTRVEKLVRLHRDFARLLHNYVAFTDFYARAGAIFQAGTLYLDGRACDMCFHVQDAQKHVKMAPLSNSFLAYVDCTRAGSAKMSIACAITAGSPDNLFEGRNGVFYDRKGRDWDATVTRVVLNPISIPLAFWSPYRNFLRAIQQMAAKRAADADAASAGKLASAAPPPKKFEVGTIAALGVAVTGIVGVFTALLTGFLGLGPWIPLGILGLVLAISGPSMFIAWLKLRQRNLGPILDANGWAVNTLTRVDIPLGASLTELGRIPEGSKRRAAEPYGPRKRAWPTVVVVLLLLGVAGYALYRTNVAHQLLPGLIPAHHVEVGLTTEDGKSSASVEQGGSVVLVVKNKQSELLVNNAADEKAMEPLDVVDGKATLTIPADMPPGTLRVSDGTTAVEITVTAKK